MIVAQIIQKVFLSNSSRHVTCKYFTVLESAGLEPS